MSKLTQTSGQKPKRLQPFPVETDEVRRRLPPWARFLLSLAEEAASPRIITLELEEEFTAALKVEYERLGNPFCTAWDEFVSMVVSIGIDQLKRIDASKALDLILGPEEGIHHN